MKGLLSSFAPRLMSPILAYRKKVLADLTERLAAVSFEVFNKACLEVREEDRRDFLERVYKEADAALFKSLSELASVHFLHKNVIEEQFGSAVGTAIVCSNLYQQESCFFGGFSLEVYRDHPDCLEKCWQQNKEYWGFRGKMLVYAAKYGKVEWISRVIDAGAASLQAEDEALNKAYQGSHLGFIQRLEEFRRQSEEEWKAGVSGIDQLPRSQNCVLVIESQTDPNQLFHGSRRILQRNLKPLIGAGFVPVFHRIDDVEMIFKIIEVLKGRENTISTLWVRAHGHTEEMIFGENRLCVKKLELIVDRLGSSSLTIVLEGCSSGKALGMGISKTRPNVTVIGANQRMTHAQLSVGDPKRVSIYLVRQDVTSRYGPQHRVSEGLHCS